MSAAMTAPLVDVRNLSVEFRSAGKSVEAVKGVSFNIAKGEIVALVGESGSGKTVSALSILKLLPYPAAHHPTGEIHFGGQDLLKASDHAMRDIRGEKISIIFQEPMTSLNPLHTILKQVGEVMKVHHGLDEATARARVLALLRKVGLTDPEKRLDAYPYQLSGGQRQRVMIAMALANEPDLLIADEPTTALDVTIQAQILELLKSLQRESGMAMLLITHDLGVVRKMADRVYVMNDGPRGRGRQDGRRARAAAARLHAPPDVGAAQGVAARAQPFRAGGAGDGEPQGLVPDQEGPVAPHRRPREGRGRRVAQVARRRDHRRRGRVRLRQDHAGPGAAAARLLAGADRLRGQTHRRPRLGGHAARCARRCRWCSRTPTGRSRRASPSARSSRRA